MVGCFYTDSVTKSRIHDGRAGFKGIGLFRTKKKSEFNSVTSEHPFILRILSYLKFLGVEPSRNICLVRGNWSGPAIGLNRIRECEKRIYLLNKFYPFVGDLDLTLFVKTTDCLLKYFFTHLKFPFYILRRAFVSKFGFPSNCLEVIQDFVES